MPPKENQNGPKAVQKACSSWKPQKIVLETETYFGNRKHRLEKKIRGDREIGYLAQPLYGVWASAPYFHNGSVPNVWEVLKPQDRYPIWRRVSAPRAEGEGNVVMGFDTNLQRAFDAEKMGWKYDRIQCESLPPMVAPGFNCSTRNIYATPWIQIFRPNPAFVAFVQ